MTDSGTTDAAPELAVINGTQKLEADFGKANGTPEPPPEKLKKEEVPVITELTMYECFRDQENRVTRTLPFTVPIVKIISPKRHKLLSAIFRKANSDRSTLMKENSAILRLSSIKNDEKREEFFSEHITDIAGQMDMTGEQTHQEFEVAMRAIQHILDTSALEPAHRVLVESPMESLFWEEDQDTEAIMRAVESFRKHRIHI